MTSFVEILLITMDFLNRKSNSAFKKNLVKRIEVLGMVEGRTLCG